MAFEPNHSRNSRTEQLALGLGWFSIGLGLTELLAPRTIARTAGMPDASPAVLRSFGMRQIAAGLAILNEPDRAAWLWARVGGDAVDLAYLASGRRRQDNTRVSAAMGAVVAVTALDVATAARLRRAAAARDVPKEDRAVRIERVVTINRSVHDVYQFWHRFENFPKFMRHLESVETIDARRSRWRARAPGGVTVEWEAEIVEDREDEWIAWRSLPGSTIENSGSVRFSPAPGARGTELRVQLQFNPPAGTLGRSIAWLAGQDPERQIHEDLRRFKQLMETGEIPLSDGPSLRRPAQPGDPEQIRALLGVRS